MHRWRSSSVTGACLLLLVVSRAGAGVAPALMSLAFSNDDDLVTAPGANGRYGAVSVTEGGATMAIVAGGHRHRLDLTASGPMSTAAYRLTSHAVPQFTSPQPALRLREFTEGRWRIQWRIDWAQPFALAGDRRYTIARIVHDEAPQIELAIEEHDGAHRLRVDAPGAPPGYSTPVPGSGSEWTLTIHYRAADVESSGAPGFLRLRIDGGLVYEDETISTYAAFNGFEVASSTGAYGPGTPNDPVNHVYGYGLAYTKGVPVGGGEIDVFPRLAGVTDAEVFALIEPDPWRGWMTLDTSDTELRIRAQVDRNEMAADWPALWASVRYGTDPQQLDQTSAAVRLDDDSQRVDAGFVGAIALTGLAPGTRYYYTPMIADDDVAPTRVTESGLVFSASTNAPVGARGIRRFIFVGCANARGDLQPHEGLAWAARLTDPPPAKLIWQDDLGYHDGSYEGGPAATLAGYGRVSKQFFENLSYRDLARSAAWHVMYGDHLCDNDWKWTWWWTSAERPTGTGELLMPTADGYPPGYTRKQLITDAMAWWQRSFREGMIGTTTDVPYNGLLAPCWRAWKTGQCHFIQLDTRSFQSNDGSDQFIGDDQRAWFDAQIADPDCPLKIILSPSPMNDVFTSGSDDWRAFPAARAALFASINANLPAGHQCLVVSGDRHVPVISRHVQAGGLAGGAPAVPACLLEFRTVPLQSGFSRYNYAEIAGDENVLWVRHGADPADPNDPGTPVRNQDFMQCFGDLVVNEFTGKITAMIRDGTTGEIMDDGTGSAGRVVVHASSIAAPCPADLDGSGAVDFADVLDVIGAWGPCGHCRGDINGDGDVGFADILALLGVWGPCRS